MDEADALQKAAHKICLGENRRHIFLCIGGQMREFRGPGAETCADYLNTPPGPRDNLGLADADTGRAAHQGGLSAHLRAGPLQSCTRRVTWYRDCSRATSSGFIQEHLPGRPAGAGS